MNHRDPDKYSALAALKPKELKSEPTSIGAEAPRQQSDKGAPRTQEPSTEVRPPGSVMPSTEHVTPIIELVTYTVNLESDALVRIYDGVVAARDGGLLVERKELLGKSPEDIQAHFALAFVPRMICDARVPIGHKMTMGKLSNAFGKRVSIFRALTAVSLFCERALLPENIAPKPADTRLPTPAVPAQAAQRDDAHQQSNEEALAIQYVRLFRSPERVAMPIPDSLKRVGPDGFPYVFLRIDPAPPDPHDNQTVVNVGDLWQAMLNEGYGLAAFAGDNAKPIWVFKYRDLLCLRLFDSSRVPEQLDEWLYPESSRHLTQRTAKMTTQRADEDIFPSYVRLALERKISATLGTPTALDPHIIEFPEMDTLKRIRLGLTANLTDDQRRAIGRELDWHLPYVVYY